jgi:endonuclease-3
MSKVIKKGAAAAVAPPKGWAPLYNAVVAHRLAVPAAPVDTIGCHKLADKGAPKEVRRFQTLVALMLSSQTRDAMTATAVGNLQRAGVATAPALAAADYAAVRAHISMVGFFNRKAEYLRAAAAIVVEQHSGAVPGDLKALMALPGVGPKMAHLFLQCADGVNSGIGVDVHVHRIAHRFGWVPPAGKLPEDSRIALERWLPPQHWGDINELLVGFGQATCTPRFPRCGECGARDLCPNAFKEQSPAAKKGDAATPRKAAAAAAAAAPGYATEEEAAALLPLGRRAADVRPTWCLADIEDVALPAAAKTKTAAKAVPAKAVPAKAVPAKAVPAKAVPAKAVPAKSAAPATGKVSKYFADSKKPPPVKRGRSASPLPKKR